LGEKSIQNITSAFELDPSQAKIFRAMVLAIDGETPEVRLQYNEELDRHFGSMSEQKKYLDLSVAKFRVIADWYHLAVLELLGIKEFRSVSKNAYQTWIATKLGLTELQVKLALDRLKSLELVDFKDGKPQKTEGLLHTGDKVPSAAIRSHHRQYLEKAIAAIDDQEFEECDFSGIIVPTDLAKLPEAKKAIQEFRKKLSQILKGDNPTEVYRMSFGLFRISSKEKK
jgi:uncharacterized protein (TIGR02147 family)